MFDWLRNLRKSAAEKDQERLTAYLDGALSKRETAAFEARLREDAALQTEVESQRQVKRLLAQAPRLRAPRSFVLDPAVYGRQKPRALPLSVRLYPQLRTATVLASLLFAAVLTLNLFGTTARQPLAQDVAMAPQATAEVAAPQAAEVADEVMVEEAVVEEAEIAQFEIVEEAAEEPPAEAEEEFFGTEMAVETEAETAPQEEAVAEPAVPLPSTAVTMGEAAAADSADDGGEEAADSAILVAPRATATPDSARMAVGSETAEAPTPSPQPTTTAESDAEPAVAAAPADEAAEMAEEGLLSGRAGPSLTVLGWLALLLGGAAGVLLLVTLWARRQSRRF